MHGVVEAVLITAVKYSSWFAYSYWMFVVPSPVWWAKSLVKGVPLHVYEDTCRVAKGLLINMASLPAGCLDSGCWTICNGTEYLSPPLPGVALVFAPILDLVGSWVSAVAVWAGLVGELPVEAVVCAALTLTLLSLLYLWLGEADDKQTKEGGERRTSTALQEGRIKSVEGGAVRNHYTGQDFASWAGIGQCQ